jgi:tRNA(adenine34) deaminase
VAIAAACRAAGTAELPGATLVSSCQPCEMCLAAARFARIGRLLFSARQETVEGRFFMFPGLTLADYHAAGAPFDWDGGRREDEVIALYRPAGG